MPTTTKRAYRRGDRKHYATLALKSVDSRIKRHIEAEVIRDATRVTTYPFRKRESDAGYDVTTPEAIKLAPGASVRVMLGLRVNCPKGYFYKICGRSSINSLGVVMTDNVIDATYTGELAVRLTNHGTKEFVAAVGDRIAQLIFLPQIHVTFKKVAAFTLESDSRGDLGWGSSGTQSFVP